MFGLLNYPMYYRRNPRFLFSDDYDFDEEERLMKSRRDLLFDAMFPEFSLPHIYIVDKDEYQDYLSQKKKKNTKKDEHCNSCDKSKESKSSCEESKTEVKSEEKSNIPSSTDKSKSVTPSKEHSVSQEYFIKTRSMKRIGDFVHITTEEKGTKSGTIKTTDTREIGDKSMTLTRVIYPNGDIDETESMKNINDDEVEAFQSQWIEVFPSCTNNACIEHDSHETSGDKVITHTHHIDSKSKSEDTNKNEEDHPSESHSESESKDKTEEKTEEKTEDKTESKSESK